MHPFGGPQACARCDKTVYAAEQVMGPGRKLYHKPCLSCVTCNKRLDSLSLREHDLQPYCKNCHTKNFGTRDLRAANLPHRDPTSPWNDPIPESPGRHDHYPDLRDSSLSTSPPVVASPVRSNTTGNSSNSFALKPTRTLMSPTASTFPTTDLEPPRETNESEDEEPKQPTPPERSMSPAKRSANGFPLPSHTGRFGALPRTVPLSPTRSISPTRARSPTRINNRAAPPPDAWDEEGDEIAPLAASPPRPGFGLGTQTTGSSTTSQPPSSMARFGAGSSVTLGRSNSSVTSSMLDKQNRPIVQTSTGTRYGAALGGTISTNVTGSGSPKKWGGTNPTCPRCNKTVYFAEQVKAVGKTYHKGCLRCTECGTTLDSNRLRDHDGDPYCVRCHNKACIIISLCYLEYNIGLQKHGPQGAGYALLGKAGG
ncbi:hypothetical protein DL96DRAFT_1711912 [Flagelloscypha sp. PMI_526]|nr:hypothetical protein DL96DRAFT_1711912 [Flagelloscypha sp. PMI_526]